MKQACLYIDLFAGCGGLSLGLINSGWTGVFAIEKNADAFSTLDYNLIKMKKHFIWPSWLEKKNIDINNLLLEKVKELEQLRGKIPLVVGGPPCQGFSMAGKREESDLRNKLCHAYLNFIEIVEPKVVFLKMFRGLQLVLRKMGKEGYHIQLL